MIKRLLNIFIAVVFVITTIPFGMIVSAALAEYKMIVNTGCSYYGTKSSSDVVGKLTFGTEVTVTEITGNYAKFAMGGKEYYMMARNLDNCTEYITAKRANLCSQPGGTSIKTLYWNDPVTVYGTVTSGGKKYVHCKYGETEGYISADFVGVNQKAVITSGVYLKEAASTDANNIILLKKGEIVSVIHKNTNWAKVISESGMGFISVSRIENDVYNINGTIYTTAKNMYNSSSGKTLRGKVYLVASNDSIGYAYVRTEAGEYYFTLTSSISEDIIKEKWYTTTEYRYLRANPDNEEGGISIPYMSELIVYDYDPETNKGAWYKVEFEGGTYYLWIPEENDILTRTPSTFTPEYDNDIQKEIVELAVYIYKNWPTQYTHGESTGQMMENGYYGFDCSGFVAYVINNVMTKRVPVYKLTKKVESIYEVEYVYNEGLNGECKVQNIALEDIKPGDVLCFDQKTEEEKPGKYCDHCAIYVGNGELIHSTDPWEDRSVVPAPFEGHFIEDLIAIKRFIPDKVVESNQNMVAIQNTKIYKEMSSDSEILTEIRTGDIVKVKFTGTGNWAYVEHDGKIGYSLKAKYEIDDSLATPTNVTAANDEKTGKPVISWDSVGGATEYQVLRSTAENSEYILIKTVADTSATDDSAVAGTTYYYKIVASDEGENVSESSEFVQCTADLAQVTGVKATNVSSSGKIKLTWDAVTGASKYEVYRATSKTGTYTKLTTTTGTSITNTKVTAGTTYYYKVMAVHSNSSANGADSTVVSRTCDVAQVTNLKATNVASSGKIKLTWDAVDGAEKYEVYRATSKDGEYTRLTTTTGTSITNTKVTAGKTYYYKVRALHTSSAATGAFSTVVSRTCDLAQVTGVKATNVSSSGKIKLTWNAVDGAKEYKVYRATSKTGTYKLMKTTTSTSYTNTSAKAGTTYYYKVMAVHSNSSANGAYSAVVSRMCDLARPTVTVKTGKTGKPVLSWNKVDGAKEYKVYRATSKTGTYTLMKTTTAASYTNTSAKAGTTYYYKVMAVHNNTSANSAYSTVVKVTSK